MDSLFGIPAHPLVVHAAVVFVPLAAIGIIAISVSAKVRRRLGVVVVGLAVLAVGFVGLAQQSGESLQEQVQRTQLVKEHTRMGENVLPWALGMLAFSGGLVALDLWRRHGTDVRSMVGMSGPAAVDGAGGSAQATLVAEAPASSAAPPPGWVRPALVVLAVLASVTAIGATVEVYLVGHSGAKAVWNSPDGTNPTKPGDGDRD